MRAKKSNEAFIEVIITEYVPKEECVVEVIRLDTKEKDILIPVEIVANGPKEEK